MARQVITDTSKVPAMLRRLSDLKGTRIKVGIMDNPELALIYIVQELGTNKAGPNRNITIPERSTLRATADSRKAKKEAFKDSSELINLNTPVLKPLDVIGIRLAEAVREKIRSSVSPQNKPSTVAAKGSARTLIDKGGLVREIKHKVV